MVNLNECILGDTLISCEGAELLYYMKDLTPNAHYPHKVKYPNGAGGTRLDDGRVAHKHVEGDHDIVKVIPMDRSGKEDVEILDVSAVDEEYADAFTKDWGIVFANGTVMQFDTEDEACEAQRIHRVNVGLDPMTGE